MNQTGEVQPAPEKVLLLMRHDGNRRQVIQLLERTHEVLVPEGTRLAPDSFDLVLTDTQGLKEWSSLLLDAKFKAEPTFLPVVLVLSRSELKQSVKSFWDIIDEFIVSPIEPHELLERVALLLRTRRLALAQQSHLAYVVNHDRVSGLPNRNLFMTRVNDAVLDAAVLGLQVHVSVLHLPLARVLKSLGHHGLDTAAARVSARLSALVGDDATLARLTTEDWGLVHRPGATLQDVLSLLKQVGTITAEPVQVGDEHVHLTPRMGVGIYPLDGTGAGSVLDHALAALETADSPTPVFYSREVQHTALHSIRIEARLHTALEEGQLELWYQPQVEIASGEAYAAEALVRWRLPNGELVQPGQFLPVAQETGLIRDIGSWAVRAACQAMREWREAGLSITRVGVNLTAQDLQAAGFLDEVHDALEVNGLPPECLELELTESDLIGTGNGNFAKLVQLRDEGMRIAIDDFGTGYSSLNYLRTLPVTTLKIDRAFINNMTLDDKDAAITEGIAWLGAKLGLEVIAEGIELKHQAEALFKIGVQKGQGYLYAKPMPDSELRKWCIKNCH